MYVVKMGLGETLVAGTC